MADNLTIDALLRRGAERLRAVPGRQSSPTARTDPGGDSPHLDVELILAHALSMSRTQLKTHPELVPAPDRIRHFLELMERRAAGEPVAYILGYRDFWTLRLAVTPAVLVPRPETELLVERALTLGGLRAEQVADLGTGSGAIALALASERPEWHVTATDISEDALAVARTNARALGLGRVDFLQGRWFEPLAARHFDLIASNPPYVSDTDAALQDLRYEPSSALTAGPDGMSSLREIIRTAPAHLRPGGRLLLEHGFAQAEAVSRELVVRGFAHVRSHRDLAGHERVTEAQWI